MEFAERYYPFLLAAFVRGRLAAQYPQDARFTRDLGDLGFGEMEELLAIGQAHELKLYKFKRKELLDRVVPVLDLLGGMQVRSLLDIGSGRGAFLWPLVDRFPSLDVHCLDILPHRVADIEAIAAGGWPGLRARLGDICDAGHEDGAFDAVCMLEVLEHIPDCDRALAEACRIARQAVFLSVPSKPDDNPEHIHLFTKERLTAMFAENGIPKPRFHSVRNHHVVLAVK